MLFPERTPLFALESFSWAVTIVSDLSSDHLSTDTPNEHFYHLREKRSRVVGNVVEADNGKLPEWAGKELVIWGKSNWMSHT